MTAQWVEEAKKCPALVDREAAWNCPAVRSLPWLILGQQQGSPGAEQLLSSTGGQAVGGFILPQGKYS